MDGIIQQITQFIIDQGALGVLVASVVEEIVVPIPSSVIQAGAGVLFLSGEAVTGHSIWILISRIAFPAAVGATIGSLVLYGLVYWGGMPFVKKFGKYFFLSPSKLEKAKEAILARKGLLVAFCVLRFIPLLPYSLLTAGAGLIRLPIRAYLWTTFVGIFIRATYLGVIGWLIGGGVESLVPKMSFAGGLILVGSAVLAISAVSALVFFYAKKRKRK